jgi:structural maintenance of chromosome 3 (chondroitin sulfate proteoglycan 6)
MEIRVCLVVDRRLRSSRAWQDVALVRASQSVASRVSHQSQRARSFTPPCPEESRLSRSKYTLADIEACLPLIYDPFLARDCGHNGVHQANHHPGLQKVRGPVLGGWPRLTRQDSYKEQTQIEPFSPKSNVIVGRNGSGKSNFFAAVRFVLGDAYHHMDREERQALLHEGSGSAVMSAYVEVCFDNSDERFPNGKSEFYLRRTIGQKKDEYSMDRKNATKADVQALLASAGFSRSNPYYIVPQGRVTALTNMKDAERLTLLKEISGSNLYEDKRKESLRLIAETDSKRSKIDEVVTDIETRLKELETERKELEDYNKKDRERRCLLYVINHQEELGYQQQIDEIDARRQNGIADTDEYSEQFVQNERDMARIDQEISQLKGQIDLLKDERAQLDGERRDLARNKARVELEYKEMTDGQSAAQKTKKRHDAELKNVQQGIKQREDELAQLLPKYNAKKDEETAVRAQLADAEGQRKRLEDKQGRQAYYSNKRQRDDALRQEINQVNMDLASRKAVLIDTNEQVTALESEIETLEGEIAELHAKIDSRNDDSKGFEKRVENARDTRDRLHDQGKELWREAAKLDSQLRNAEQQLYAAERALSHLTNMETGKGLDTLRRLQKQHKLDGVYGTVGELIKVNPNYKIAAEACAGPSLFHVVVDSDTTSSKIVDMLNKERGGRITFIPLNRMTIKNTQLPKATDAQSLIAKIQYDPTHEKAMQSIFGNAIVCPDLTIAAGYARTHGVKALTPDGDQAHRKGHLFGGWIDPSKSSLDAIQNVAQIREEVEEQRIRRSQIKKEQEKLEQQVTASISELRKIEQQKDQAEHSYGPMRQELKDRQNELQNKQDALIEKRMTAANVESALNLLGDRQGDLDAELNSDFKKKLSSDEEQMLATLAVSVKDLRGQLSKLTSERSELEARKSVVELELRENLQPTLDQLTSQENGATGSTTQSARLKESERLLKKATRALEAVDGKINEAENQIEELNVQLAQSETSRDEKAQANRQLAVAIEKHKKRMNRSMQDRAQAQEDLARVQKEIRELGTLPEEAWTTYGSWSSEKVRIHSSSNPTLINLATGVSTSPQSQRSPKEVLACQQESL